jgi:hypothetical protein
MIYTGQSVPITTVWLKCNFYVSMVGWGSLFVSIIKSNWWFTCLVTCTVHVMMYVDQCTLVLVHHGLWVMVFNATFNYNICMIYTGQSVPITTKVVSWNPDHDEVYSILHYVIKFVSDLWQVSGFLWVFRFPPPIKMNTTCMF